MHQRAAFGWTREYDLPPINSARSRIATSPMPRLVSGCSAKPAAVVLHFELQRCGKENANAPSLLRSGVTRDIVQSFLEHTVNVHPGAAIDRKRLALLLIGYCNSGLSFHGGDVPVKRALKPSFIEHDRMQRLRKAANFVQGALHDLAELPANPRAGTNPPAHDSRRVGASSRSR